MGDAKKSEFLGTMPLGRLIFKLALPASVALFANSAYNLVDTIFVGQGVGALAIGAVALLFPFRIVVMSFGNLFGIGGASVVSRAMGAGSFDRARDAAGSALGAAAIVGILIGVFGSLFTPALVRVLGGTGELYGPTYEYTRIIVLSEPFLCFNFAANFLIRAEGRARAAMLALTSGIVLNIILDPIFIFAFDWGIGGAALATLFGHMLSSAIAVVYFVRARGVLRIRLRSLVPRWRHLSETLAVGVSGFVRQLSQGVVQVLRNNLLVVIGGSMAVSAVGVAFRTVLILALPAMGVAQALPPIAGYNFGAGNAGRVRRSLGLAIGFTTLFTATASLVLFLAPGAILRVFSDDAALLEQGAIFVRISAALLLFFPSYFIGGAFFQAIGQAGKAFVLALLRPGIGLVGMLIAASLGSAAAVVAADPISVIVGAAVVYFLVTSSFRNDKRLAVAPD